jgi:hypothetical protein
MIWARFSVLNLFILTIMLEASDRKAGDLRSSRYIRRVSRVARYEAGSDSRDHRESLPIPPPAETKEGAWERKIERAIEIRESTAKAREGKPVAFPMRRARA